MNTFQYFDIMERYARGPMTAEERSAFERQLSLDRELAAEWADYQLIARSIRSTLRSKVLAQPDIKQLVSDARDLAQSEGLLFTDEDIWDYCRGKMPLDSLVVFERRLRTDAHFAAQVNGQKIILEGVQNFSRRQKTVQKVRDSLRSEGFTGSLHRQIEQDIAEERRRSLPPFSTQKQRPPRPPLWIFALLGMVAVLSAVFFFWPTGKPTFDTAAEIELARKNLPNMAAFQQVTNPDIDKAARFAAQNLPDAALAHLRILPPEQRPPEAALLEGLAQMEKSDFAAAQSALEPALQAGSGETSSTAAWLAALCCFKLEQHAQSQGLAQRVLAESTSSAAQRDAAKRLLEHLP